MDELVLFRISRLVGLMEDWVAGRTAATPGAEGLWEVLGERSRAKEVLVKRFAYQLRWLHANVLAPDRIGPVLRDPELGTWTDDLDLVAVNGNRQLGPLPGYLPDTSPVMSDMDDELRRILPGWDSLRDRIVNQTWPCAPKAFRYYERILYGIGRLRRAPDDEPVLRFLGGLGEGPDKGACREWWVADGSRVPFPFRAGFVGV